MILFEKQGFKYLAGEFPHRFFVILFGMVSKKINYYVYILKCKDTSLYVGSTNDLEKRLHAHNHLKSGAHYTKIRRPVSLVYSKKCKTYAEVRKREGELKALTRQEKLELIKKGTGNRDQRSVKKPVFIS